ncbi:MAG: Coenzyme F420 hydrogenase/dehydrogenase, beta subunit C-terminal domain [Bacillota bacterium]
MFSEQGGPVELKTQVQDRNMCTACGACAGLCPYIYTVREKVAVIYPCGRTAGSCYRVCPRTPTALGELDRRVFGAPRTDHVLGEHSAIYFSRAQDKEINARAQYGGTVTALLAFLLQQGRIDAALLARGNGAAPPEPFVAATREDLLAGAGSKYSACPTLAVLPQAVREGYRRLAVVGRPCQVTALRKMQGLAREGQLPHLPAAGPDIFVIGLFCFWALTPAFYTFLAQKAGSAEIRKVDIPAEGLKLTLAGGQELLFPVDEVRPLIRPACPDCFDPTAELADVSVGSTEYDPAWNTLLVRTPAGKALVEEARAAGVIALKPYPEERLPLLRRAALNKKRRVLSAQKGDGYLHLPDDYRQKLQGGIA